MSRNLFGNNIKSFQENLADIKGETDSDLYKSALDEANKTSSPLYSDFGGPTSTYTEAPQSWGNMFSKGLKGAVGTGTAIIKQVGSTLGDVILGGGQLFGNTVNTIIKPEDTGNGLWANLKENFFKGFEEGSYQQKLYQAIHPNAPKGQDLLDIGIQTVGEGIGGFMGGTEFLASSAIGGLLSATGADKPIGEVVGKGAGYVSKALNAIGIHVDEDAINNAVMNTLMGGASKLGKTGFRAIRDLKAEYAKDLELNPKKNTPTEINSTESINNLFNQKTPAPELSPEDLVNMVVEFANEKGKKKISHNDIVDILNRNGIDNNLEPKLDPNNLVDGEKEISKIAESATPVNEKVKKAQEELSAIEAKARAELEKIASEPKKDKKVDRNKDEYGLDKTYKDYQSKRDSKIYEDLAIAGFFKDFAHEKGALEELGLTSEYADVVREATTRLEQNGLIKKGETKDGITEFTFTEEGMKKFKPKGGESIQIPEAMLLEPKELKAKKTLERITNIKEDIAKLNELHKEAIAKNMGEVSKDIADKYLKKYEEGGIEALDIESEVKGALNQIGVETSIRNSGIKLKEIKDLFKQVDEDIRLTDEERVLRKKMAEDSLEEYAKINEIPLEKGWRDNIKDTLKELDDFRKFGIKAKDLEIPKWYKEYVSNSGWKKSMKTIHELTEKLAKFKNDKKALNELHNDLKREYTDAVKRMSSFIEKNGYLPKEDVRFLKKQFLSNTNIRDYKHLEHQIAKFYKEFKIREFAQAHSKIKELLHKINKNAISTNQIKKIGKGGTKKEVLPYDFYSIGKEIERYYKLSKDIPLDKLRNIETFLEHLTEMGNNVLNEKIKEKRSGVLEIVDEIENKGVVEDIARIEDNFKQDSVLGRTFARIGSAFDWAGDSIRKAYYEFQRYGKDTKFFKEVFVKTHLLNNKANAIIQKYYGTMLPEFDKFFKANKNITPEEWTKYYISKQGKGALETLIHENNTTRVSIEELEAITKKIESSKGYKELEEFMWGKDGKGGIVGDLWSHSNQAWKEMYPTGKSLGSVPYYLPIIEINEIPDVNLEQAQFGPRSMNESFTKNRTGVNKRKFTMEYGLNRLVSRMVTSETRFAVLKPHLDMMRSLYTRLQNKKLLGKHVAEYLNGYISFIATNGQLAEMGNSSAVGRAAIHGLNKTIHWTNVLALINSVSVGMKQGLSAIVAEGFGYNTRTGMKLYIENLRKGIHPADYNYSLKNRYGETILMDVGNSLTDTKIRKYTEIGTMGMKVFDGVTASIIFSSVVHKLMKERNPDITIKDIEFDKVPEDIMEMSGIEVGNIMGSMDITDASPFQRSVIGRAVMSLKGPLIAVANKFWFEVFPELGTKEGWKGENLKRNMGFISSIVGMAMADKLVGAAISTWRERATETEQEKRDRLAGKYRNAYSEQNYKILKILTGDFDPQFMSAVAQGTLEQFVPGVSNITSFINPNDRAVGITSLDILSKLVSNNLQAGMQMVDGNRYNDTTGWTIGLMKLVKQDLMVKDLDTIFENMTGIGIDKAERTHKESPIYKAIQKLKKELTSGKIDGDQVDEYLDSESYKIYQN